MDIYHPVYTYMNIYYKQHTFHNSIDHCQTFLSYQYIPNIRIRSPRYNVRYMYENLARLCMYR